MCESCDQPIELALEDDLHSGAERGALMHQGSDGDVPAIAHLAEHIFSGHADIAEEQLAEFALAGHLPQRPDFDAGRFHVHQDVSESFVFRGIRIGAGEERAPIGCPAVTGPNFLAVDDVVIAVELRFGADVGEIGAGVGLGESLAPDFGWR